MCLLELSVKFLFNFFRIEDSEAVLRNVILALTILEKKWSGLKTKLLSGFLKSKISVVLNSQTKQFLKLMVGGVVGEDLPIDVRSFFIDWNLILLCVHFLVKQSSFIKYNMSISYKSASFFFFSTFQLTWIDFLLQPLCKSSFCLEKRNFHQVSWSEIQKKLEIKKKITAGKPFELNLLLIWETT